MKIKGTRLQPLTVVRHIERILRSTKLLYPSRRRRICAAVLLPSDDMLADALKFLTRIELCTVQLVSRRLRRLVESDSMMAQGPYHLLCYMKINRIKKVGALKGATWGDGSREPPPPIRMRLLTMRCVKSLARYSEVIKNAVKDREYEEQMRCYDLSTKYLESLPEEEPLPTSALELTLKGYQRCSAPARYRKWFSRGRSGTNLAHIQKKDGDESTYFLLADACRYPLPRYVRFNSRVTINLPYHYRHQAEDLRQWLYASRESFANIYLRMDAEENSNAPWLLDKVFTRLRGLGSDNFTLLQLPASLMSERCHTIRLHFTKECTIEQIVKWLHRQLPCNSAHSGGERANDNFGAQPSHLVISVVPKSWRYIAELMARAKEASLFLELFMEWESGHATPTFIVSAAVFQDGGGPMPTHAPFELHNKSTGEKLVMKPDCEDDTGLRFFSLYRCCQEAEEEMRVHLKRGIDDFNSRLIG